MNEKVAAECGSEKSLPNDNDIERDTSSIPATDDNNVPQEAPKQATTTSGDRAVVLMDLRNGLVGWESPEDPENPQYVLHYE